MSRNQLMLTTSPRSQPAGKPCGTPSPALRQRPLYERKRHYHTGKERDSETGLYYYGARYLDSKTSRWLSGDPAMGDYIPSAPVNDEARKRNGNLPGMGGVFNYVNLHAYHYAGNNPVNLTDPDGRAVPAIVAKLLKDAGAGAVKGAAVAVTMKYLATSIIRFIKGESLDTAFTMREGDWTEYGEAALKGAGSGAVSGLLSNIPVIGRLARSGSFGSALATAGVNMASTSVTTITENIIERRDITEGLGQNILVSGILGFVVGLSSPLGMTKGYVNSFHPITGKPNVMDKSIYMPSEYAIRAKLYEILWDSFEEIINAALEEQF